MPEGSRRELLVRRIAAWAVGWTVAAAFYLLLIDITDLPELIVGAGAAVLAATGFELAREQHILEASVRIRWLARLRRPLAKVPTDVAFLVADAIRQLVRPSSARGEFRAVAFEAGGERRLQVGRRALAESAGSFAPNTIIVGVDPERGLVLGHQLRRSGGREAIDLLRLG